MPLILAVFLGGCLGTSLRFAVDLAMPHAGDQFPTGTLLVNVFGALVLGALVGGLWTRPAVPAWLKAALGTGVLGSFTTFSAVMVTVVGLGSEGAGLLAAAYVAASVVLGFGAAALGLRVGAVLGRGGRPPRLRRRR